MKIFLHTFVILSLFVIILLPGCSMTSSGEGSVSIWGTVLDTTVFPNARIQGAYVTLTQSGTTLTTTTDSTGTFSFTEITAGDCEVSISKYNYYKFTKIYTVTSDSVTVVTIPMIPKSVYVFNNIVLDEYLSAASYSAANFQTGQRVQDLQTDKDVQFRDTLVGIDNLFYLRSAAMDAINPGKETYFSNSLVQTFSKSEFDTLSKFPTIDNTLNPYRDFPFQEGMDKFFNYGVQHNVCAFYLIGRWLGSPAPRTYGLLYVDSVWYDGTQKINKMLVHIKINTKELNEFNPNPSK